MPQWGTANAEIVSSFAENLKLFKFPPFEAWIGSEYSLICFACYQVLQSSELAEPLWTDPGIQSEISVSELTSN